MAGSVPRVLRALVVEDQELFRKAIAEELGFFGFETTTVKDGEEGLKASNSLDFDIILSDMRMPNKDGRWLLHQLRKTRKSFPPFIFITGFTELTHQEAYEMGADGFLSKPFDSDKLAALLASVCRPLESRWSEAPKQPPHEHISKDLSADDTNTFRKQIVLGRGGMFLAMEKTPLKPGQTVSFEISLSDGHLKCIKGSGTIIWRNDQADETSDCGYGIAFDYIAPSSLPSWLAYLRAREIVAVIPDGRFYEDFEDKRLTV